MYYEVNESYKNTLPIHFYCMCFPLYRQKIEQLSCWEFNKIYKFCSPKKYEEKRAQKPKGILCLFPRLSFMRGGEQYNCLAK